MNKHRTDFLPISSIGIRPARAHDALAFSSLVLSPYEEVDQTTPSGAIVQIVLVNQGEVTLRFPEHNRVLERDRAMHVPADVSYSIWNHTPWRSTILRVELNPTLVRESEKFRVATSLESHASNRP